MMKVWISADVFSTVTAVTLGFALWDRRTMRRPFEDKGDEPYVGGIV